MNIVLIGTAYPLRGGIAHYMALLYRHLAKRHHVDVVTFSRQYPAILFPGKSQEEQGAEGVVIPSEQLIDSINPASWISAARKIAAKKPDLLVFKYWLPFFGPCFGTISYLVRRWTGAKTLFICDNVIPHERRPGDVLFTRYAFGSVDYFIAQSHAVERELREFWPRARAAYVPHPVYEIFGKSVSRASARKALHLSARRVILFFGYVRAYKGLMTLLEAMPRILDQMDVTCLVVGEFYESDQPYRRFILANQLEKHVILHSEYIPNDEVGLYFSAADCVVLPYRSATQSGIVQIAYNFGKPVIATDVGGLAEVVLDGKTGSIVPPGDPESLANAVVQFYRKKAEPRLARNVKSEKKKYSWQNLVRVIEQFME